MALLSEHNSSKSSSNHYYACRNASSGRKSSESARRSNVQASAYSVNARDMALTGFHFSTCGAGAPSGPPHTPPPSPPHRSLSRRSSSDSNSSGTNSGRGDAAAHHITEESERLFCETLRAVFLVEKNTGLQTSLVMDVQNTRHSAATIPKATILRYGQPTPVPSPGPDAPTSGIRAPAVLSHQSGVNPAIVREYIEMWDYAGGARFRGFVAEKDGREDATMFVFFDREVFGKDLKPGLMSLLELAGSPHFECSKLVVGVDRTADSEDVKDLTRNLGWVGFELLMLDEWARGEEACTSNRWIFLGMET